MNIVKNSILGLVSFGLGVATGYLVCKKPLDAKYQEEIEIVKEALGVYAEKQADIRAEEEEIEAEKEAAKVIINEELYNSSHKNPRFNYSKPDLNELAKTRLEFVKDEDEDEGDEEDAEIEDEEYEQELLDAADDFARRQEENMLNNLPYVIDYDDFVDGPDEYEKESLYFYTDDGYLCDEDDQVIEEDEELVGHHFEDLLDTQTMAWVRNDFVEKLYEIHRVDRSYQKDIRGLAETPREREIRLAERDGRTRDE